jgi:hypothetical protein
MASVCLSSCTCIYVCMLNTSKNDLRGSYECMLEYSAYMCMLEYGSYECMLE